MITFEEAKTIALNNINSDCDILPDSIIEKPYGWYFSYQSEKYIEIGNILDMHVGSGGFLVKKDDGKIIEFGSAYPLEQNFEIYEKGFLRRNLDLVITKVFDLNESARLLNRLSMTYLGVKIENGVEWKIPKSYNEKQIKKAISSCPAHFIIKIFISVMMNFRKLTIQNVLNMNCAKIENKWRRF